MKKASIALYCIILCTMTMLFSNNVVFVHPVSASSLPKTGAPFPVSDSEIASLKPNMACPQPPTTIDHAALSNADLDKYGLPHYQPGEDKAAWKDTVRVMKHRVCSGTTLNRTSSFATNTHPANPKGNTCSTSDLGLTNWTGNIAVNASNDGTCTQNNQYTEADAVFYVPCIKPGSPTGLEASWVGLGGWENSSLVQAGSESDVTNISGVPSYSYYAWTANIAASQFQTWLFSVKCNDRMQVFVYHSDKTYIIDHTSGNYNTTTTGPAASYDTAEWIVERTSACASGTCIPQPLADFQSDTFYGMGTTFAPSSYVSPHDIHHDYSNMNGRTRIGPLVSNTLWGPPNCANTITWVHQ